MKQVDKYFRDQLYSHKSDVSKNTWEKISKDLEKNNITNKSKMRYTTFGFFLIICVLCWQSSISNLALDQSVNTIDDTRLYDLQSLLKTNNTQHSTSKKPIIFDPNQYNINNHSGVSDITNNNVELEIITTYYDASVIGNSEKKTLTFENNVEIHNYLKIDFIETKNISVISIPIRKITPSNYCIEHQ